MAPTSNILRAARPAFHHFAQPFRPQFRQQQGSRRWQSTASEGGGRAGQQSWFGRAWESEVGIRTVHFWAPVMKWCLVLAGISDFARPAEKLSFTQNFALTCTGIIWTRWCFVIKPKNYLLAAVNFFLGLVGIIQISRISMYRSSKKNENPVADAIEEVKDKIKA